VSAPVIPGFEDRTIATDSGNVFVHEGPRAGPALLLLHGFPQTALMWRDVAPLLAKKFAVVAADLPGYGRSACPDDLPYHASMSKRSMAKTLVEAMCVLGHERFAIAGHDRGGRVAYRAALDAPQSITGIAILDVLPTAEVWDRADARLMLSFWPFSFLAQPEPLPEKLIMARPAAVVDDALSNWGTSPDVFTPAVRQAYVEALGDPAHVHAICEEYRAAAGVDREQDKVDLEAGRAIACPVLVLWSASGGLASWYEEDGGPIRIWRRWASQVHGRPVPGGHFFPEEHPELTAELIRDFLLREAALSRSVGATVEA
jgi:haloacetate dehalogenase